MEINTYVISAITCTAFPVVIEYPEMFKNFSSLVPKFPYAVYSAPHEIGDKYAFEIVAEIKAESYENAINLIKEQFDVKNIFHYS